MVANVRNLQTGYVYPQYNCVFDDCFETIFSTKLDNIALDKIFDEILQGSREWYSEEDYEDGKLVYSTTLLHELWLTDPDRRDRKDKFMQQSWRAE